MDNPKIEKWIINIGKIKEDDWGKEFVDKQFSLTQLFDADRVKPGKEYLDLMLKKFYNDITHSDFFEE